MRTSIEIKGLKLFGRHGVMEQERNTGNEFVVDMEIFFPFEKACETDSVSDTINYAEIVEIIKSTNSEPSALIENFAWRIKEAVTQRFAAIEGGKIKVYKPYPPIRNIQLDSVSATIEW